MRRTALHRFPGGKTLIALTGLCLLMACADLAGVVSLPAALIAGLLPVLLLAHFAVRFNFGSRHWFGGALCAAGCIGLSGEHVLLGLVAAVAGASLVLWDPPDEREPVA